MPSPKKPRSSPPGDKTATSVWETRKASRTSGPARPRSTTGEAPKRPTAQPARPADAKRREHKVYGIAACQALWERRPHDIVRVYVEEALIPNFTPLLRWAAGKRKAYHIVGAEDLERLTESIHHQGICILARERSALEFNDLLGLLREDQGRQLLVYLDGVENPHNLGAIVRTCAHFGVRFILGAEGRLPRLSGAACRVAEGGAEQVGLVLLRQPARHLRQLQEQGFQLIATAGGRGTSLYQHSFAARSLLILGAEGEGVSGTLFEMAERVLRIPGSGSVESLNVSVACGVCLGEYYRQHAGKTDSPAGAATARGQSRKK